MTFFVKHLKTTRSGFWIMLVMQGFVFLFGLLMVVCINLFVNEDRDYALIGSLMALVVPAFGGIARGNGAMNRYRMAVSMGYPRRFYLLADPFITALNCGEGIIFAWILSKFELWVYNILYPGWEMDFDVIAMMEWWYFLLIIVGACVLDYLMGALILRFGNKAFAILFCPLGLSGVFLNATVGAARRGSASLLAQLGRGMLFMAGLLRPAVWAAVGAVLLLVLLVLSTMVYRKAEIRA